MSKNEKKYPKGYWMSVGIRIGVALVTNVKWYVDYLKSMTKG